jgi:hypothetical protein
VGGLACKYIKSQGLLKEIYMIGLWISNPTAAAAVDRAVNPVPGSMVDQAKGYRLDLVRTVRGRSHGPGRERATRGGGHIGTERGRWREVVLRRRSLGKGFLAAKMSTCECYA